MTAEKESAIVNVCGYNVLLDKEDSMLIDKYKYYVASSPKKRGYIYFYRTIITNGKHYTAILHRDVMKCTKETGGIVDHINGNTLDCRKQNLRICTRTENNRNSKMHRNNKSGIKGVYFHKASNKWAAQITVDRKIIHLGCYEDINMARDTYRDAVKKYHGDFGRAE